MSFVTVDHENPHHRDTDRKRSSLATPEAEPPALARAGGARTSAMPG
jgi:hypothetical protein